MMDLDDLACISQVDRSDMKVLLRGFPRQCSQAWELFVDVPSFEQIAVCGMGGSAIGGDYLKIYLAQKGFPKPVFVIRGYELPPFVGDKTLVFAVSYSGNTEETLSCFEQALRRGSFLVALTSGGRLAQRAHEKGVPLISIPQGLPPRTALGYLFFPLLKSLGKLLNEEALEGEFQEALETLKGLAPLYAEAPEAENPAKQLARAWYGRIPVIYGGEGRTDAVARRWKTQINENAKSPAHWDVLPELHHNEIMGWERPELREHFAYTLLRDRDDPPKLRRRFDLSREILKERGGLVWEAQGTGEKTLARLLSLSYLGDWSSFYLAMLYEVDPTPVPLIEELKRRLKGS